MLLRSEGAGEPPSRGVVVLLAAGSPGDEQGERRVVPHRAARGGFFL